MPSCNEHLGAVGEFVRLRRREVLLSQDQLAARSGVAPAAIARLETGLAIALASFLRVLRALSEEGDPGNPATPPVLLSEVPHQDTGTLPASHEVDPAAL